MRTKERIEETYKLSKLDLIAEIVDACGPLMLVLPNKNNIHGMDCIYITDEDKPSSEEFNNATIAFLEAFRKYNEEIIEPRKEMTE